MKNMLYFNHINTIGGVETFFYMLAKKYHDWDITVYYKTGDWKQILRLNQYAHVRQYQGEVIECDKAFFNYNTDIIDNVKANEYIEIIHADFVALNKIMNYKPNVHPKIDKYIAVSQIASDSFYELTGIKPEVCYNPLILDTPKKVLHLITASRLTREKGRDRMIKLANALDNAKIPYLWTVFTNDTNVINNPNIVYMKPRLDITDYIADADFLVQLSDTEAYSYSIIESLSLGTPVIVTPLPVLKEMRVDDTNSIIIDFDMQDIPVDKIYKGLPTFEYKSNKDRWDELMAKGKTTKKKEDVKTTVSVKPIKRYFDLQFNKIMTTADGAFEVTQERAETLLSLGLVKIVQ